MLNLYLTSINIATETTPHSQANDISHVKRHYVMNPICGRYVLQSRQDSFLTSDLDFGLEFIQSGNLFHLFRYKVPNFWSHVRDGL